MMQKERIGRYEIKSELGRGGMATVYLAHDPRFRRDVAVKVLPRQFTHDPRFRARFEREAQTIATLEHAAIVPVYDFGEEDGQPHLVMRYMPGGSLADRLANGALPLTQVAKVLDRVAAALDHAHGQGTVHRDLKPGNILFDQYGKAYLADFGIVKLAEATLSLTGDSVIGTPAYMSPEQVKRGRGLDSRSDVYSLGVILFQMLSGRIPFEADTPTQQMMAHVLDPVPDILEVKRNLPPRCRTIIAQAMAKEPGERYGTAGELAAAVATVARKEELEHVSSPDGGEVVSLNTVVIDDTVLEESPVKANTTDLSPQALTPETPRRDSMLTTLTWWLTSREPLGGSVKKRLTVFRSGIVVTVIVALSLLAVSIMGDWDAIDRTVEPTSTATSNPPEVAGPSVSSLTPESSVPGNDATSISGGERWVVIMSRSEEDIQQRWYLQPDFPKDYIEEKWTEGFDLTSLVYGKDRWAAVMSGDSNNVQQLLYTQNTFPGEYIGQKWNESFDVTSLAYGDDRWAVVMTHNSEDVQQLLYTQNTFPGDYIEQKWNESFDVTTLAYGNGRWAVIMTHSNEDIQQLLYTQNTFPGDYIEQKWADGFDVTSLAYGDGRWAVIMSRGREDVQQLLYTFSTYPRDYIEQRWAEGFNVTNLAYGE